MKSVECIDWSKESFNTINYFRFRLIGLIELKDTNGQPLLGSKDYGIYSKMNSKKSVYLDFTSVTRLEIKETGVLGITLKNDISLRNSDGEHLSVLDITSEYM